MFEFFSQFRNDGLPGNPPSRDTPPHSAPPPPAQPDPSNFHAQFSYSSPFPASTGHPPFTGYHPQSHPPPTAGPANNPFGLPLRPEEPVKLNEVWFSGEPFQLEAFLKEIRNFIHHRSTRFSSDSRVIVWVSLHFGFRPSENRKGPSKSQNWYTSLIRQNARLQNKLTPYADLEQLEFVLPVLASWEAFEAGFIKFFGDKFQADTAKAALDACKQGLNLNIQKRVENSGWRALSSLDDRMQVAAEAAKDLEIIARFSDQSSHPPKAKPAFPPHLYQHPHSSQRASDAMDIDATTVHNARRPFTPFEILFRRVCLAQRCCFRCLKRTSPPDHSGPSNCPNGRTSLAEKERFVERYRLSPPESVPVAACTSDPAVPSSFHGFDHTPSGLPVSIPPVLSNPSALPSQPMSQNYGFDEIYDDLSEAHLATVKGRRQTSSIGNLLTTTSFRLDNARPLFGALALTVTKESAVQSLMTGPDESTFHRSIPRRRFLFRVPSASPALGLSTPSLASLGSIGNLGPPRAAPPEVIVLP
ncbi:hypothetical protein Pst134EB_016445 [Puccinia striiformis f. sp. tritici]|nr:hypothetical protein Pst134EB_016445 [Puccinia striiformis f. sp. tritici]